MLNELKARLQQALLWLKTQKPMPEPTQNALKIYQTAKSALGTSLVTDGAPQALGCAITVWNVVFKATGTKIGGVPIESTTTLYQMLLSSPSFESVTLEQAGEGDIIISPTGYAPNKLAHGHTGIVGNFGILSNNSEDGLLEENYTKQSWNNYFGVSRGFPVICFRML